MKLWNRNNKLRPWMMMPSGFLVTGTLINDTTSAPFWQVLIPTPVFDWEFNYSLNSFVIGFKWLAVRRAHGRTSTSFYVRKIRHEARLS